MVGKAPISGNYVNSGGRPAPIPSRELISNAQIKDGHDIAGETCGTCSDSTFVRRRLLSQVVENVGKKGNVEVARCIQNDEEKEDQLDSMGSSPFETGRAKKTLSKWSTASLNRHYYTTYRRVGAKRSN